MQRISNSGSEVLVTPDQLQEVLLWHTFILKKLHFRDLNLNLMHGDYYKLLKEPLYHTESANKETYVMFCLTFFTVIFSLQ